MGFPRTHVARTPRPRSGVNAQKQGTVQLAPLSLVLKRSETRHDQPPPAPPRRPRTTSANNTHAHHKRNKRIGWLHYAHALG